MPSNHVVGSAVPLKQCCRNLPIEKFSLQKTTTQSSSAILQAGNHLPSPLANSAMDAVILAGKVSMDDHPSQPKFFVVGHSAMDAVPGVSTSDCLLSKWVKSVVWNQDFSEMTTTYQLVFRINNVVLRLFMLEHHVTLITNFVVQIDFALLQTLTPTKIKA